MISIVICSIDGRKTAAVTEMYGRLLLGHPHEIIHIPDARGFARGTTGAWRRAGESWLSFRMMTLSFSRRILHAAAGAHGALRHRGRGGDGQGVRRRLERRRATSCLRAGDPFGNRPGYFRVLVCSVPSRRVDRMQAMDGVFLCCRREVAQPIGFDQSARSPAITCTTWISLTGHTWRGIGWRCAWTWILFTRRCRPMTKTGRPKSGSSAKNTPRPGASAIAMAANCVCCGADDRRAPGNHPARALARGAAPREKG